MDIFQKNSLVQAIDPVTRTWTKCKILECSGETINVTWPGFSRQYDCCLPMAKVRMSIDERPLPRLVRKEFSKIQSGEKVVDRTRGKVFVVDENDLFKGEVNIVVVLL